MPCSPRNGNTRNAITSWETSGWNYRDIPSEYWARNALKRNPTEGRIIDHHWQQTSIVVWMVRRDFDTCDNENVFAKAIASAYAEPDAGFSDIWRRQLEIDMSISLLLAKSMHEARKRLTETFTRSFEIPLNARPESCYYIRTWELQQKQTGMNSRNIAIVYQLFHWVYAQPFNRPMLSCLLAPPENLLMRPSTNANAFKIRFWLLSHIFFDPSLLKSIEWKPKLASETIKSTSSISLTLARISTPLFTKLSASLATYPPPAPSSLPQPWGIRFCSSAINYSFHIVSFILTQLFLGQTSKLSTLDGF